MTTTYADRVIVATDRLIQVPVNYGLTCTKWVCAGRAWAEDFLYDSDNKIIHVKLDDGRKIVLWSHNVQRHVYEGVMEILP